MHNFDLSGIWVALVTPFLDQAGHHRVDHASLRRLVAHLKPTGVTGFVALGSTGEASSLDDAEQDAVIETVLDAAEALPVMAGLSGSHAGHLHRRLARLNALPLKAVLSPAPCYVRPSQAGLLAHFTGLADASRAPLVLYDIPYRTGVHLAEETILALAGHGNIHGIKDCGGSPDKTQTLIADGRLAVLCGEDAAVFHHLCLGGAGAITAAAQVRPEAFVAMYRSLRTGLGGGLAEGRQAHHALVPWMRALFAEPNPSVIKAALHRMGLCGPWTRPPLLPASEAADAAMAHLMQGA